MSRLDQLIAATFPGYALRRMAAMRAVRAMDAVGAYEAAKKSRLHKATRESRGPNKSVADAAVSLREQARSLEQNSDLARSVLGVMTANVIGMGINPEPQIRLADGTLHEELNQRLADLHRDWRLRPEVTWEHDEHQAQRLAFRSALRDGEILAQHVTGPGKIQHGTRVPYSYEIIEPDYLPMLKRDVAKGIEHGVERNAWGRPIAYHLAKREIVEEYAAARISLTADTRRLPARQITHLKLVDRARQIRGVSLFASTMSRIADIDEIDETERVAARVSAAMAVWIEKGDPYLYNAPVDGGDYREIEFVPGMVIDDLQPGEKMQSANSTRPNNELIAFRQDHMRGVAGGTGAGYSSISKHYDGSYSAQRQELIEQHTHYGMLWAWFVSGWELPKWSEFLDAVVLADRDVVGLLEQSDPLTLRDCDFSRPAMPWVDPVKEMKGVELELGLGINSKSSVMRSRGRDPREVERQRANEDHTTPEPAAPAPAAGDEDEE